LVGTSVLVIFLISLLPLFAPLLRLIVELDQLMCVVEARVPKRELKKQKEKVKNFSALPKHSVTSFSTCKRVLWEQLMIYLQHLH